MVLPLAVHLNVLGCVRGRPLALLLAAEVLAREALVMVDNLEQKLFLGTLTVALGNQPLFLLFFLARALGGRGGRGRSV